MNIFGVIEAKAARHDSESRGSGLNEANTAELRDASRTFDRVARFLPIC